MTAPEICASRAIKFDNEKGDDSMQGLGVKAPHVMSDSEDDHDIQNDPTIDPALFGGVSTSTEFQLVPQTTVHELENTSQPLMTAAPTTTPLMSAHFANEVEVLPGPDTNVAGPSPQNLPTPASAAPHMATSSSTSVPPAPANVDHPCMTPCPESPQSCTSRLEEGEEWSDILSGLKKRPGLPTVKPPKVKKPRTTRSERLRTPKKASATSEHEGRGMRVRKASRKEVVPLTVGEDGKQVSDAYGNPLQGRKGNKL
ncbi:hypothetical protein C0992_000489, partial [Termitomyces sp. T32_za158]